MKIAIIDSTAYRCLLSKNTAHIINKAGLNKKDTKLNYHGTLVVNTIYKYINENLHIDVYNICNSIKGNSDVLIAALEDLIYDNDVKIILICAVINRIDVEPIEKLLKRLYEKGKIIIVSSSNKGVHSYPAISKYVIGVGRGAFLGKNEFSIDYQSEIQITGDVMPEFIKLNNNRYRIFSGTSKAVPKVLGYILEAYSHGAGKLNEILDYISVYASENHYDIDNFQYSIEEAADREFIDRVLNIANCSGFLRGELMDGKTNILCELKNIADADLLYQYINKRLRINLDISKLTYFDFYTIESYCYWMEKNIDKYG